MSQTSSSRTAGYDSQADVSSKWASLSTVLLDEGITDSMPKLFGAQDLCGRLEFRAQCCCSLSLDIYLNGKE